MQQLQSPLHELSTEVWSRLRCVDCGHALARTPTGARCTACGAAYSSDENGSLDLRPRNPKPYALEITVEIPPPTEHSFVSEPLRASATPQVDFSGLGVPRHLTHQLLSYFPRASRAGDLMLDLGCGEAVHRQVCERAGYEWVGVDYSARSAPILADAQAIPFQDHTFDFVLCVTVLQYIQNPFVAMREIFRVLRPNGLVIGSVAFLEPSHGTSFYHPSHVGTYSLLRQAGLTVQHIGPFTDWPALKAMASMGMFHGMPRELAQIIVSPMQFLHVLWWRLGGLVTGHNLERDRLNHFSGSFSFIAMKPG